MVACRLLDRDTCRCRDYDQRTQRVPDCRKLTASNLEATDWLPDSCAYQRLAAGKPLAWWHPLVSGDRETVHRAGISVRGLTLPEEDVHPDDRERMILDFNE
jgi:hypothetical protein